MTPDEARAYLASSRSYGIEKPVHLEKVDDSNAVLVRLADGDRALEVVALRRRGDGYHELGVLVTLSGTEGRPRVVRDGHADDLVAQLLCEAVRQLGAAAPSMNTLVREGGLMGRFVLGIPAPPPPPAPPAPAEVLELPGDPAIEAAAPEGSAA